MNKHDRAKMITRLHRALWNASWFHGDSKVRAAVERILVREVDRAIRAERRAQKLATEEANKWREEAEQRAIDAMSEKFGVKL